VEKEGNLLRKDKVISKTLEDFALVALLGENSGSVSINLISYLNRGLISDIHSKNQQVTCFSRLGKKMGCNGDAK
jgi:hypothetical protein